MKLEILRSKLNILRTIIRKEKVSEMNIETYVESKDGELSPIKEVKSYKTDDGKYFVVFKD